METAPEYIALVLFVGAVLWFTIQQFVIAFSNQPTYRQRLTDRALSRPTEEILQEIDRDEDAEEFEDDFQELPLSISKIHPEAFNKLRRHPELFHALPDGFDDLDGPDQKAVVDALIGLKKAKEKKRAEVLKEGSELEIITKINR